MANVTKIYELRTIGYPELMTQLKSIETEFNNIKKVKQDLNNNKFSAEDADRLRKVNAELKEARIRHRELLLEKQLLRNQIIAEQSAKQQEIKNTKVATEANKAEAGSLRDLINQRRQLQNFLQTTNPNSGRLITLGGQQLNYAQAQQQVAALNGQINALTGNMRTMNQVGSGVTNALTTGFNRMRGSLASMIVTYAGWFAAFREAGRLINENVKLSDSFADLQIRIHGTKEDVEDLFEELKKIDTRTSLIHLVDIANVIAKKGVPREDIAGLTAEFDKLNVVLGSEIGQPDTAAANIIKLITIFNDDKQVTAERVNEIATSLFKLTTTGVATGEFLVNFAERVGAVRGITGLTLPAILGMGAALQQLGQRTEVAGTAAVQLTTRIFADIPKFALAAGKSIQDFRKLLDEDPFEALVAVAEGLKDLSGDELAAEFEEVVSAFQEVGIVGVRVKAVLGDIATNADFVRDRMRTAIATSKDYENQSAALELKQNTLAAVLQRIRKEFETIATNKAVQVTLAAIGTVILAIVSSLNIIIPLLGIYAALWAVANARMIATWVTTRALALSTAVYHTILAAGQIILRAYTASIVVLRTAMIALTSASTMAGAYLRALGGTAVIAAIGIAIVYLTKKAEQARKAAEELRKLNQQQLINREITIKANEATADQISKLETLVRVITSNITSLDSKKRALQELISINQAFSGVIKDNIVDVNALSTALNNVRGQIILNARAQAAADLTSGKYQEFLRVVTARQTLETRAAEGTPGTFGTKRVNSITTRDLPTGEREYISGLLPKPNPKGDLLIDGILYSSKEVFAAISTKEQEYLKNYEAYSNTAARLQDEINRQNATNAPLAEAQGRVTLDSRIAEAQTIPLNIQELETIIKQIDTAREKLKEGNPKLNELLIAKRGFEERLKLLRGDESTTGGRNRREGLENFEKDALSIIEANRRIALAQRSLEFAELQKDHRATYEEEIKFVEDKRDIDQLYLGYKVQYLERQKTLNAREKEILATFKKEIIDIELKAQDDIQSIKDREFNLRSRELKRQLDNQINEINVRTAIIENDASQSETTKAQARASANQQILSLEEQFNANIDVLEKQLNQKSEENLKQGAKTREEILKDTLRVLNAMIEDAEIAGDKLSDEFRIRAADATIEILKSKKSLAQQARELQQLENQLNRDLLAVEAASLRIQLDLYEKGLESKLKSEQEYLDAKRKLKEAEVKLTEDTVERELDVFDRFVRALKGVGDALLQGVFKIKTYTKDAEGEREKEEDAWQETAELIGQAMQEGIRNYFDSQRQQIDIQRNAQLDRLAIEEEQVKARAQSQAEIESIEKQYDEKRRQLERRAGEDKKKIALQELTLHYALFVLKSLAQYGLPLALLPIAAGTALYFVQRANVQRQQFEEGGIIDTKKGGPIRGRSHKQGGIRFNYEAEGDELAIINKRSARDNRVRTITGTNMQIASMINQLGGGIAFKPGASLSRFEAGGLLGSNYQPPVYNSNSSGQDIVNFIQEVRNLADEQSKRIDRLEVIQVTRTVTEAQKKEVKQNSIGVL